MTIPRFLRACTWGEALSDQWRGKDSRLCLDGGHLDFQHLDENHLAERIWLCVDPTDADYGIGPGLTEVYRKQRDQSGDECDELHRQNNDLLMQIRSIEKNGDALHMEINGLKNELAMVTNDAMDAAKEVERLKLEAKHEPFLALPPELQQVVDETMAARHRETIKKISDAIAETEETES